MLTMKITAKNFFNGFFVGIGAVIPGVSGGTIAMIIGIFDDTIEATANLFKHIRKSLLLLLPVTLGAGIGAFTLSILLDILNNEFPTSMKIIYCTISLISAILFAKLNLKGKKHIYSFLFGVISALFISILLRQPIFSNLEHNVTNLFLLGFPLALALVLPAISFSYMLLYFGIYDHFIQALRLMELSFLFPLLFGIISGAFMFSKLFLSLVNKRKKETYSFVFGFVIFSIVDIVTKL